MRIMIPTFVFLVAAGMAVAAEIPGTVRDAGNGRPIANARVAIAGSTEQAQTDSAGAFSLPAPNRFPAVLVVSRPGFLPHRQDLDGVPQRPLELLLEPAITFADGIQVTASRAREGSDPVSFSNIPEEKVHEYNWGQDPALLLSAIGPGFFAYNDSGNGIGYSYFTVRGFTQARSRVTINGAPLNDAESGELFFIDLADFLSTAGDIQLRRGVFGLSGIGGAIDITTEPAPSEPSFTLHGGLGSFATRRFQVHYDSGLIDGTWAVTARYSKITSDGYRDQSWVDMWNYFLSLSRFGERSRLRVILFGGPEQTHLAYDGVPKSVLDGGLTGNRERDRRFNPITYPGEIDNFTQPHYQLVHELSLGAATDFAQTLYAFRGDGYYDQLRSNRSLREYNLPDVTLPDGTVVSRSDLVRRRNVGEWDYGWLPSLTHRAGAWTLTVNGELRLHEAHHFGEVKWAQFYPSGVAPDRRYYDYRVEKQTGALALGVSWQATRALTFSGGVQVTHHLYEMSHDRVKGVAFDDPYTFVLPRLGAVLHLGEGADAYLNVARGMHEPNFRDIYDPQDYYGTRVKLDPEDVIDTEAGVSLRRGSWRARANLYFMSFRNAIVYAGALDDNGVPIYGNGAQARHRGVELDGTWAPASAVSFDGALTLAHNTFTRYRTFGWDGTVQRYDGNRTAAYPDVMGRVGTRVLVGLFELGLDARYIGRFYLDNSEDNRKDPAARQQAGYVPLINPAATVVDMRARMDIPQVLVGRFGLPKLAIEARVNNLLDRRYTAFGYVDGEPLFIPAAGRTAYVGITIGL